LPTDDAAPELSAPASGDRLAALEDAVAELREDVTSLRSELTALRSRTAEQGSLS